MFLMAAKDDILVDPKNVPVNIIKRSNNKIFMLTDSGSHASYICGYFKYRLWFPKPVFEFINHFKDLEETLP